jgi:hypothetical protein
MYGGKYVLKFVFRMIVLVTVISGVIPGCTDNPEPASPVQTQQDEIVSPLANVNPDLATAAGDQNHNPEITSSPPTTLVPGFPYIYPVQAIDPDGDKLTWSLEEAPAGLMIDPQSGMAGAEILPAGEHAVSVRVEDGKGGSDTQQFTLNLSGGPVILSVPPEYTYTATLYNYSIDALDPGGSPLLYSIVSGPAGMIIDQDNGLLEWQADIGGTYDIILAVSNSKGEMARQNFSLRVLEPAAIQIISDAKTEAYDSIVYEYQLAVLNTQGGEVNYHFNNAPAGMTIEPTSGLVTWTPATAGVFPVEVAVINAMGYSDTQSFSIRVMSLAAMDRMFSDLLEGMFNELSKSDLFSAMEYFTLDAQTNYGPIFEQLLDQIEEVAANYTNPERISINEEMAEYVVRRVGGNGDRVFIITFMKDENGEWKINSM